MLEECKKASVYDLDRRHLMDAKVCYIDKDTMKLIFSENPSEVLKTETLVTFYDNKEGLVTYLCGLFQHKRGSVLGSQLQYEVSCQLKQQIEIIQRRKDIKVKVDFPMEVEILGEDDKKVVVPARALDISAGGIAFKSERKFDKGDNFIFLFDKGDCPIILKGEILRVLEHEPEIGEADSQMQYAYGCRFIELLPFNESVIRRFAFQYQLRFRKM